MDTITTLFIILYDYLQAIINTLLALSIIFLFYVLFDVITYEIKKHRERRN